VASGFHPSGDHAISTDDDHHGGSYCHDRRLGNCPVREDCCEQEKEWTGPRYLRFGSTGPSWSWTDPDTRSAVFDLATRDIDVSVDGRKWFHFAGSACLQRLPHYRRE
jgi:hypothetical protein